MGIAQNTSPYAPLGLVDPRDYGAVAGGSVDCTAALNAAMLAAGPGGTVYFPPGDWLFSGNVTCQPQVYLLGSGRGLNSLDFQRSVSGQPEQYTGGTRFLITGSPGVSSATATAFLTPASGTTVEGIAFFYPNQGIAPSVTAYPYTIGTPYFGSLGNYDDCSAYNVTIKGCVFANSYQAIRLWSCFPLTIEDCTIRAAKQGIWIDQCYDTSVVRRVMIIQVGLIDGIAENGTAYLIQNLIAYRFDRVDSLYLVDSMVFGCATGIYLGLSSQDTSGQSPWFNASNVVLDYCNIGIDVQSAAPHGINVNNASITTPPAGYVSYDPPDSIGIRLGSGANDNNGSFRIGSSYVSSAAGNEVQIASGSFQASACTFGSLGNAASGDNNSVVVTGGNASVVGCKFDDARPQMDFSGGGKAIFANNVTGSNGVSVTGVTASNCV